MRPESSHDLFREPARLVRSGDVYLIPLLPGQQTLVTILGLGSPPWNPRLTVMLVGAHEGLVVGVPPVGTPGPLLRHYWCVCSFVEEGNWSLVRHEATPVFQLP